MHIGSFYLQLKVSLLLALMKTNKIVIENSILIHIFMMLWSLQIYISQALGSGLGLCATVSHLWVYEIQSPQSKLSDVH